MRRILLIFTLLFSVLAMGQTFTVSGKVVDESLQAVSFANVLLRKAQDSTVIKGTTTDDVGGFELNASAGNYLVKTSFLGFSTLFTTVSVSNSDLVLSDIILKESIQTLAGVELTAKRPTVERKIDRLVFNVENTTLSEGTTWNVLQRTPGVIAIQGDIIVRGSTPVIYINDKRVYLSTSELQQLLEGTPANTIKSVEVITNPPAKYDADGGSVINIVMRKNLVTGYNGSVYGNYTQWIYPKYRIGTNHFYKTDKINLYTNYNYRYRKADRLNDVTINFYEDGNPTDTWITHSDSDMWREHHNAALNFDYFINPKSTFAFSARTMFNPYYKREIDSRTTILETATQQIDSNFNSNNIYKRNAKNIALYADYEYNINDDGEKIIVNTHYTYYNDAQNQQVITDYFLPDETLTQTNIFDNFSNQKIKIFTTQTDYCLPTKTTTFETGAKVAVINSQSDLRQETVAGEAENLDDLFLYDEMNTAAYLSFEKNWKNWSLKIGLRGENTAIQTNSVSEGSNKQNYFKLFPTFYLQYTPSDKHDFTLSYGKRIERPVYSSLNPFRFYLNDNSYSSGDPNLRPTIERQVEFIYTFKQNYTFDFYMRYINDPIYDLEFQENDTKIIRYQETNLELNRWYGFDFSMSQNLTNKWSLYLLFANFYNEDTFIAIEDNNQTIENGKWSNYTYLTSDYTFLKDKSLVAEVSWLFISPVVFGSKTISSRSNISFGLRKTLWDKRTSLSLQINDIFNGSGSFTSTNKYLNQDNTTRSRFEMNTVEIGFRYKFGNYKLKTNKKAINKEERDRIKTS